MTYYLPTSKAQLWYKGKLPGPPPQEAHLLEGLMELIAENDVPRTGEQIARAARLDFKRSEGALKNLVDLGFIQVAQPTPTESYHTPKPRIRSIEELLESEEKARQARQRYDQSLKGVMAHIRYELSPKGLEKNKRYWQTRGKLIQKAYRLRRNIKSMTKAGSDPKLIEIERAKLAEVEAQLKREEERSSGQ
ncbi:MAG: hypothetical protein QW212_00845 [Nitrososphaerales archaeon]